MLSGAVNAVQRGILSIGKTRGAEESSQVERAGRRKEIGQGRIEYRLETRHEKQLIQKQNNLCDTDLGRLKEGFLPACIYRAVSLKSELQH